MQELQDIFFKEFCETRFIRIDDLKVPCPPELLSAQIVTHCREALEHLEENWIPAAASLLRENKHLWQNLVPTRDNDVKSIKSFFETVGTLMSIQLRYIIENSVNDFVEYVEEFANGNKNHDQEFFATSLIQVEICVNRNRGQLEFLPTLEQSKTVLQSSIIHIVHHACQVPRVEAKLFENLVDNDSDGLNNESSNVGLLIESEGEQSSLIQKSAKDLKLRSVPRHDELISKAQERLGEVFKCNLLGPKGYLSNYDGFKQLYNKMHSNMINQFLRKATTSEPKCFEDVLDILEEFREKLKELQSLQDSISQMRLFKPLNLVTLDCVNVNDTLWQEAEKLIRSLIQFQVDLNQSVNKQ